MTRAGPSPMGQRSCPSFFENCIARNRLLTTANDQELRITTKLVVVLRDACRVLPSRQRFRACRIEAFRLLASQSGHRRERPQERLLALPWVRWREARPRK